MKKFILKTTFLTIGVALVLAVAVFGMLSLFAPAVLMELTDSVGLETISGDYAYQEYERSKDPDYLIRAFEVAARHENDNVAEERFEILYHKEDFEGICERWGTLSVYQNGEIVSQTTYREYWCGLAARVKYRLARTDTEKAAVIEFALSETDPAFSSYNPSVALATEALRRSDRPFCSLLRESLLAGGFEHSQDFETIVKFLEETANE